MEFGQSVPSVLVLNSAKHIHSSSFPTGHKEKKYLPFNGHCRDCDSLFTALSTVNTPHPTLYMSRGRSHTPVNLTKLLPSASEQRFPAGSQPLLPFNSEVEMHGAAEPSTFAGRMKSCDWTPLEFSYLTIKRNYLRAEKVTLRVSEQQTST